MGIKSETLGLNKSIKIGLLTSSRADFGIYYPLICKLNSDDFFNLEIIAFGTHLDKGYGYTVQEIESYNFEVSHRIETPTSNHDSADTSNSIGVIIQKFSKFWSQNNFDLVLSLGDRYEMFAAVTAAFPFQIDFAHIHSGETTLGAIDNVFRHSISLMSNYLFTSTEIFKKRAIQINLKPSNVFNVGALSYDNLENTDLYSIDQFHKLYDIDLNKPTILSTFHPETVSLKKNHSHIENLIKSFEKLKSNYQIVITMPNTDTLGDMIRNKLINYSKEINNIFIIESFGMRGYLSCMKYCSFLLGNTSSGFVEAAYFPKKVINLGIRQSGRIVTENIVNSPVLVSSILKAVKIVENMKLPKSIDIYKKGSASENIINIIKSTYEKRPNN